MIWEDYSAIDRQIQWTGQSARTSGQVGAGMWKTTYADAHELRIGEYDQ